MIHLFLFFPLFFLPFFLLPSSLINASLLETVHRGKATFYSATVLGHCSYPNPSSDLYVALASNLYASGSLCGSCIKVWPGEREEEDTSTHLILPVVDECPTCDPHQIDLSFTAFAHLASPTQGILQIHWRL
ncbi:MAG: RlpA-like double-psi beta-barrel-protein domain-containing protein-containing protein, partial [Piptocephalis tieghemiana]